MDKNYLKIIGLHVLIGLLIFQFKILGELYFYGIIVYFFFKIISAKPSIKPIIIFQACGYVISSEIILRMTGSGLFYESSKYLLILLSVLGLIYNGFNKKAAPYIFYIILLIPSVYISLYSLDVSVNIRKAIAFNLSGPVTLGIIALFAYNIKVNKEQLLSIINNMIYPIVSLAIYIFIYNPDVSSVSTGTGSNFAASGGFGPNQVSTILGLGFFLMTVRYFYFSKTKILRLVDLGFILLIAFRAIVTFSRGGVFTAIIMIGVFLFFVYKQSEQTKKKQIKISMILFFMVGSITWILSALQTNGMIEKRYANQNAIGLEKEDISTGRTDLFVEEFNYFLNNPFLGIGVGRVKDLRFQTTGIHAATHNEMSRIIAEHGLLGIFAFLILLLTPLLFRLKDRSNVLFFSFYLFWFLTINHSSMRIAAPAFIYALSLIHIKNETPSLHREQITK